MIVYENEKQYLQTATRLEDKLNAIESIIAGLLQAADDAAGKEYITEYSLNDGQTQIRTVYRGLEAIMASIQKWETLANLYRGRLQKNRVRRLVDSKNFTGRC